MYLSKATRRNTHNQQITNAPKPSYEYIGIRILKSRYEELLHDDGATLW